MTITSDRVREIFKGLETGDGAAFFDHVADDVDWTVMGTHLAGHYLSKKAFIEGTFAKLGQVLPQGAELNTEHLIVKDDEAVVELHSSDGQERHALRQPLLLGSLFPGRFDRTCSCLSRLGDGRQIVRGESNRLAGVGSRLTRS